MSADVNCFITARCYTQRAVQRAVLWHVCRQSVRPLDCDHIQLGWNSSKIILTVS